MRSKLTAAAIVHYILPLLHALRLMNFVCYEGITTDLISSELATGRKRACYITVVVIKQHTYQIQANKLSATSEHVDCGPHACWQVVATCIALRLLLPCGTTLQYTAAVPNKQNVL
jgi:hypothetical protein